MIYLNLLSQVFYIFNLGEGGDIFSTFLFFFWTFFIIMFLLGLLFPGWQLNLFTAFSLRRIEDKIKILDFLDMRGKKTLAEQLKKYGGNAEKLKEHIQELIEFFEIGPVEKDPYGVLNRLEYILDLTRYRFRALLKTYAPNINEDKIATLEDTAAVAHVIHFINKVAKHFYLLAKKYRNYYLTQQVEFLMPFLIDLAKNFFRALPATTHELPIGDGIGPMVITRLYRELGITETKDLGNEMTISEGYYKNRKLILLKAKGPAGRVGKPGTAVKQIIEEYNDKINLIITIDAAQKLEGEETGAIAQGIGAAIGDPGPEKFKIEESAIKYRIPLIAIIIKQSFNEAVSPMVKQIADKADEVVERIKKLIIEMVPDKGTVLVVGIGNTLGIGNAS